MPKNTDIHAVASETVHADQCGATKLERWRSEVLTDQLLTAIKSELGHDRIRVVKPGMAVTMDYRPDRLNIDVDDDGRITRFHCV